MHLKILLFKTKCSSIQNIKIIPNEMLIIISYIVSEELIIKVSEKYNTKASISITQAYLLEKIFLSLVLLYFLRINFLYLYAINNFITPYINKDKDTKIQDNIIQG